MPFLAKQFLLGRPLRTTQMGETLLPKRLALPVFCSDPMSSVAYATEEILLVLALGGTALLHLAWYVAVAIAVLLAVVVASYRQTCHAYPNGGGAYVVSHDNLGQNAALTAASALLVDYVLTVAVSVVAGVAAITSALPALSRHAVALSIGFTVLLVVMNLRGVKESGRVFAIPTYGFVLGIYLMFTFAAVRLAMGHTLRAESAGLPIRSTATYAGAGLVLLAMRAFASGSTALTGVEAISNGVPAFRKPKPKNAAATLAVMGALSITMFAGITVLALLSKVHVASDPTALGLPAGANPPTALAQIARASFGDARVLFYSVQAFTAGILILAANTAFNGFPLLASILAQDRYLPRQLQHRGDRLVFSNGIVLLALAATGLIVAFDATLSSIIQLYIIGVFVSFTLSQAGMVRHWNTELADTTNPAARRCMRRSQAINAVGASFTGIVLVIVLVTKFTHGAWIVTIAMPVLFLLMKAVRRHYDSVAEELKVTPDAGPKPPSRNHAVVLVSTVHAPTLRAVGYATSTHPSSIEAVTVSVDPDETHALAKAWDAHGLDMPLVVLESPFREITRPVLDYLRRRRLDTPRDVVTVFIPEYVLGRWWEQILHNQSALRLKARLLFMPGVMVTSVPYVLRSATQRTEPPGPPVTAR
ncbi:APC family permease [Streptomyces sp. WAC00263]|uniref:APC family permease n=1 Tax=Streptomyces sp. WAC00263 TaxID=1917422 RepID=UPI0015EF581D|nr:APC family permease [Streptomyces sp. WAC00263]KAF5990635.1 DNA-binding protein [Streptomyces sp. WAC00263]